jgi:hypothetical protein
MDVSGNVADTVRRFVNLCVNTETLFILLQVQKNCESV